MKHNIKAAGCMIYTSDGRFLIGFNPRIGAWTGIGGKREAGEDPHETALRETFEEIYGVVPTFTRISCSSTTPIIVDHYAIYPLHIDQLIAAGPCQRPSPYYSSVPASPDDLCRLRIILPTQEVTHLRLVKPAEILADTTISEEYLGDLIEFLRRWPILTY